MAQKNKGARDILSHPNVKARILPHNSEAEQSVLGCALIDENAAVYICGECKEDDFYSSAHKDIYAGILAVYYENKPVDIVTLVQKLEAMGVMDSVGGISYLSSLTNVVPSASNYRHYVEIVKKNSLLRKLIYASQNIIDIAYSGDIENDVMTFAESEIFSISKQQEKSYLRPIAGAVNDAIKEMELLYADPKAFRGIPTGFTRLNAMLNGFQKGDLVIIGARPSQGKTSIGMNFVLSAVMNKERKDKSGEVIPYRAAVFSLEMPAVSIAKRLLCTVAKVSMSHANSGNLSKDEFKRLMEARAILSEAHIHIDDSGLNTPIDILSKCRRLKREQGLDIIMIDYLGLMKSGVKTENKQQDISEITRLMKIAAKELHVPILLLSQLSREVEKRNVKVPQMSDLRESGAIEQDADVIIFIYREHDPSDVSIDESLRNKVELIIAKHRNGETGKVEVRWKPEYVSFEDPPNMVKSLEAASPPNSGERGNFAISEDNYFAAHDTEEILAADVDELLD